MPIYLHGGKCCGIKQIFQLGCDPEDEADEKAETPPAPYEGSSHINSPVDFFHPAAPEETTGERLDRYLAFIKEKRPKGLVEVVLSSYQFAGWRKPLEKLGFTKVSAFKNGNSGNPCEVYHLVMNGD